MTRAAFGGVLGLAVLLGVSPLAAGAQETVSGLAAECGAGDGFREAWCREVALATVAARSGLGLLASGGSEPSGSAGTLGWRVDGVPRVSGALRLGLASVASPRLGWRGDADEPRIPAPDRSFVASTVRLDAAVGIFEGFSPRPTVGGVLSVDALASTAFAFLPGSRGFGDGATSSVGLGARLGLLRESFTLPAVSVSAAHRWWGAVELRPAVGGEATPGGSFDLSASSLRGTVGKDLYGVGVLLGAGWDRYAGRARLDSGLPGEDDGWDASSDDLVDSRLVAFAGASRTFLVLQLSAEVGWAGGLDPVSGREAGGWDPEDASWFGSVAARLTY